MTWDRGAAIPLLGGPLPRGAVEIPWPGNERDTREGKTDRSAHERAAREQEVP